MKSTQKLTAIAALVLSLLHFSACKDRDKDPNAELKTAVIQQFSAIASANYEDCYTSAAALRGAIDDFVANPSSVTHQAAKDAWLEARESYGQTEAYRFGDGPIDDADGPEGLINAWPLDENYIDYMDGQPDAGIVNDTTIALSAAALEAMNETGGEENISVGFHAIEFLLWGQDDVNTALLTAGQRPYTDYVTGSGGTASHQDRRGLVLKFCATQLEAHLRDLRDAWASGSTSNYRHTFESLDNDEALRRIFTGIGVLSKSELAGERIFTALDNQSQEDEHSCFSDNTHRDIILNFLGIRNVYRGSYSRPDGSVVAGASLSELADEYDADLNASIEALLNTITTQVNSIPVPFDNALTQEQVGGNGPIQSTVNSLQALGDKFAEIAGKMDITISTALPE
ncbi:MAG: imelysin family protein [Bacteroidia bacterium]